MSDIAVKCILDLETRLKKVQASMGRVFHIYSEVEMLDKTKGVSYPCIGVVYNGMRANGDPGKSTNKMGMSAEFTATLMIFFRPDTRADNDIKVDMVKLLDDLRDEVRKASSPSGHKWEFVFETSMEGKNGILVYLQRWSTPVLLI